MTSCELCARDPYNPKTYQAYMDMLNTFKLHAYAQPVAERMNKLSREWSE